MTSRGNIVFDYRGIWDWGQKQTSDEADLNEKQGVHSFLVSLAILRTP